MEAKVYEPFPDGSVPEGWPREYVSKADYVSALADIDELQTANREWALSDAKTRSGWFIQRVRSLEERNRELISALREIAWDHIRPNFRQIARAALGSPPSGDEKHG